MKKLLLAFAFAAAAAGVLRAQDSKTTTTVKVDDAKTVTYTGCLGGVASQGFFLENAMPVMKEGKSETKVENKGDEAKTETKSESKYALVPGDKVDFQKEVGQKVEVTAILIPSGHDHTTIETTTKTEVEGQADRKSEVKEKVAQTDLPQLRVVSVKHLSDRCIP
jgi:hypothetical protein